MLETGSPGRPPRLSECYAQSTITVPPWRDRFCHHTAPSTAQEETTAQVVDLYERGEADNAGRRRSNRFINLRLLQVHGANTVIIVITDRQRSSRLAGQDEKGGKMPTGTKAVSYTHLTLPTTDRV